MADIDRIPGPCAICSHTFVSVMGEGGILILINTYKVMNTIHCVHSFDMQFQNTFEMKRQAKESTICI